MAQTITISIPDDLYAKLLLKIGRGNISQYMVELLKKALQDEEKLEKEYLLIIEDEGCNEVWE